MPPPSPGSPAGAFRSMLIEAVKQGASINTLNVWLKGTQAKGLRAHSFSRAEAGQFFSHALHAMRQAVLLRDQPPMTAMAPANPVINPFINSAGLERYEYMSRIRFTDATGKTDETYFFYPSDVALAREDVIAIARQEVMGRRQDEKWGSPPKSIEGRVDVEVVAIQRAY